MNSTEMVNSIFGSLMPQVDSFIQGDLLAVITAVISLLFIILAATKIYEILNMTTADRELKSSFLNYKRDKGTWREQISKRKYHKSLRDYDDSEKGI